MRVRRRRVLRSVVTILLTSALLVVLTVLLRDQQSLDSCLERMRAVQREFQQLRDAGQAPPRDLLATVDVDEDVRKSVRDHVFYNWFFTESPRAEVGVCCCRYPHDRIFRAAGRHVLVYVPGQRRYELRWMDEDEFLRRSELGLSRGLQP
jgi:hypothetical protein